MNLHTMKRKVIYSLVAAALAALSCEPSHLNDNLPASEVYFLSGGFRPATVFDTQKQAVCPVYAYCGGFWGGSPTVSVSVDADALARYNEANYTHYKALPDDCWSLERTQVEMTGGKGCFNVLFDVQKLLSHSTKADYSDLSEYVLPLALTSLNSDVKASAEDDLGFVLLNTAVTKVYCNVYSCSSENSVNKAANACDGNTSTWWETNVNDREAPFELVLTLPMACNVSGFDIWRDPRVTKAHKESGTIEVSEDNVSWTTVVEFAYGTDVTNNTKAVIHHTFPVVKAQYIRWTCKETNRRSSAGGKMTGLAELKAIVE